MAPSLVEQFDPALKKRVASGLVLATVTIVDVILGGWFLALLALVAGVVMAYEWAGLTCTTGPEDPARSIVTVLVGAGAALTVVAVMLAPFEEAFVLLLLAALLAACVAALAVGAPVARTAAGIAYIGIPLACVIWLRNAPEHGSGAVIWLLAIVWSVDSFAYFAGRTIGGAKLAPSISPGKTWAGLLGGMAGAALVGVLLAPSIAHVWWQALLLAAVLAAVAQAGDLFESWLKRRAGVKDSGSLIPGHGGLLDRLDGLLLASPVFAALVIW